MTASWGGADGYDADGDGSSPEDGDCDDDEPWVSPEAVEACNDIDDNCDGTVDEGCESDTAAAADTSKDAGACGCGATGSAPAAGLMLAAALVRRRRQ